MFSVILIPDFPLQAVLRHDPELWERPVAVVDVTRSTPLVCACTAPASASAVQAGLTPPQALARCGSLLIRPRSPAQEQATTDALVQTAYGFSPHIEATAPGVLTLDLRKLASVPCGQPEALAQWAREIQKAIHALGLRSRVGVGPTPNVARHAARWGDGLGIATHPEAWIASLPVAALDPSDATAGILEQWGIRTVGALLALGQQEVTERLGLEAFALFAAASPSASRPLKHVLPAERYEESFDLAEPVETLEPLLFLLRRFIEQLSRRLEPAGLAATAMRLLLRLESGAAVDQHLAIPSPTRDVDALFRMVCTRLETMRTDAPVAGVSLQVLPVRPGQRQLGLFESALKDPLRYHETLARLSALVGADRVGSPLRENSHRPDAFRLVPPDFENAPRVEAVRNPVAPLPIRRFRPPLPAEVSTSPSTTLPASPNPGVAAVTGQDGRPPVALRCMIAHGRLRIVIGPSHSSGHWWEKDAWTREEWDVETHHGQVVRLVRQRDGWSVEGILD